MGRIQRYSSLGYACSHDKAVDAVTKINHNSDEHHGGDSHGISGGEHGQVEGRDGLPAVASLNESVTVPPLYIAVDGSLEKNSGKQVHPPPLPTRLRELRPDDSWRNPEGSGNLTLSLVGEDRAQGLDFRERADLLR